MLYLTSLVWDANWHVFFRWNLFGQVCKRNVLSLLVAFGKYFSRNVTKLPSRSILSQGSLPGGVRSGRHMREPVEKEWIKYRTTSFARFPWKVGADEPVQIMYKSRLGQNWGDSLLLLLLLLLLESVRSRFLGGTCACGPTYLLLLWYFQKLSLGVWEKGASSQTDILRISFDRSFAHHYQGSVNSNCHSNNKLASLVATLVWNYDSLTDLLTDKGKV